MVPKSYDLRWRGTLASAQARSGAERGVRLGAEFLLGEARKLVPIEEGTLERSGRADVDGLTGAVSFDGPYAVRQHEELTWRHDPGRQAKYLEQPATENGDMIRRIIGEQIKRSLGGGG